MIALRGEAAKLTGFRPHVRFGSKADVTLLNFDVRFTPESRHSPTRSGCLLWANTGSRWNLFDRLPEPARRLMLASALFVACAEQSSSASELGWQWRRHAGLRSANQLASRTLGELFANPDGRISPHAPISIPYRFSAGPIAIGRRGHHVYRRRCVVAWAGDRRSDNSPCG
jgi:hypothetical protein